MTMKEIYNLINTMIKEYQSDMEEAQVEEDEANTSFYMGAAWSLTLLIMKLRRGERK